MLLTVLSYDAMRFCSRSNHPKKRY